MSIIIVDEKDHSIGTRDRSHLLPNDIYRVAALWISNSKGEILLAQRSFSKKNNPGKWGPTVVGTVEEGETYEDNIIKETFEEIGLEIDPAELTKGSKERREGEANDYFRQWYLLTIDKEIEDFTIQKSEVENLQWFDKIALAKSVKEKPEMFMQSVKQWVELSFKDEN